jgi:hypothetical protein
VHVSLVARRFRTRLFPALITALGVGLLATGLLSYTEAVEPAVALKPLASYNPLPTLNPAQLPGGDPLQSGFPADRVATRVVVPRLGIDLPVMLQQGDQYGDYPLCDVALYLPFLSQPGQGRATYIYAHAREGMFLPLLIASQSNDGKRMLGDIVQVYTSDNYVFIYQISEVHRHTTDLNDAFSATSEEIFLQTSEGPNGTIPKLQVVADYLSSAPADPVAAHPNAHPRICR